MDQLALVIESCFDSHDCSELWSESMHLSFLGRSFHIWTLAQPFRKQVRFAIDLKHRDVLSSQVEPWLEAVQFYDSLIHLTSCSMKFRGKFSEKLRYDP